MISLNSKSTVVIKKSRNETQKLETSVTPRIISTKINLQHSSISHSSCCDQIYFIILVSYLNICKTNSKRYFYFTYVTVFENTYTQ